MADKKENSNLEPGTEETNVLGPQWLFKAYD